MIPKSRNEGYDTQVRLLKTYCQKAQVAYEAPHLLEAAVSIFMEYLQTGKRLYSDNPDTYTRCQERVSSRPDWPLAVGSFAAGSLVVCMSYDVSQNFGVGSVGSFRTLAKALEFVPLVFSFFWGQRLPAPLFHRVLDCSLSEQVSPLKKKDERIFVGITALRNLTFSMFTFFDF